ncbi:hypothetical protein AO073_12310 [Pseudomonas syringae ICMP 11293]|nr:hypothetical protein AO073_12310 [Pseudomonas syringae ICMP 11293]
MRGRAAASLIYSCLRIVRVEAPFQLFVLVTQFALLGRPNGLLIFQRGFKRQHLGMQLVSLFQQLIAAVLPFLDLVHVSGLCSIRLGVGCVAGEAGSAGATSISGDALRQSAHKKRRLRTSSFAIWWAGVI